MALVPELVSRVLWMMALLSETMPETMAETMAEMKMLPEEKKTEVEKIRWCEPVEQDSVDRSSARLWQYGASERFEPHLEAGKQIMNQSQRWPVRDKNYVNWKA